MNIPMWSFPVSPFNPSNYYSYPYMQSPFHTGVMLNSTFQTSLNSSSGYESGTNEASFIDPCFASPSSMIKDSSLHQQSNVVNKMQFDEETDDSMILMSDPENDHGRKKRRILSRPQRQEANRRERERMDIINDAYEKLRNVLPFKKGRKRQKMSRMDTVDGAIRYIHSLLETLNGPDYNPNWAK